MKAYRWCGGKIAHILDLSTGWKGSVSLFDRFAPDHNRMDGALRQDVKTKRKIPASGEIRTLAVKPAASHFSYIFVCSLSFYRYDFKH
jgi:hypothetical protein